MKQHTVQTPYVVGDAHFYTAEIAGDLVLFDTGPDTPEALACLNDRVDIGRLKYVFITHCHADHYGLAAHIAEHSAAEIFLPGKDAVKLRRNEERLGHIRKFLEGYGFDDKFISRLADTRDEKKIFPPVPFRYTIVEESDIPQKLGISCLACPGHSQSDLVYKYSGHAVTGDVLLRNIFQVPLLDVELETFAGRFRNYDAYCTSLIEIGKLRGFKILPGHQEYVHGIDDAVHFYVRKLMERALLVKRFAGIELVSDVMAHIFGKQIGDPFYVYLKVSEIVFMRDFLSEPYKLKNSLEQIGLFAAVSGLYAAATE